MKKELSIRACPGFSVLPNPRPLVLHRGPQVWLEEHNGIVFEKLPPPGPIMEIWIEGTLWKAVLRQPIDFYTWKAKHKVESSEQFYFAYNRYLRAFYAKEGKCVRYFMNAAHSKGRPKHGKSV